MNIFATSSSPIQSAKEHCDKHLVKQIAESMQLLVTAHYVLDGRLIDGIKPTHQNHPCAIWARESYDNYMWLEDFTYALMFEYQRRYGKRHSYAKVLDTLLCPNSICLTGGLTPFANVTGDFKEYSSDVHENYKAYLNDKFKVWATRTDKRKIFVKWTNREVPSWVDKWIFSLGGV